MHPEFEYNSTCLQDCLLSPSIASCCVVEIVSFVFDCIIFTIYAGFILYWNNCGSLLWSLRLFLFPDMNGRFIESNVEQQKVWQSDDLETVAIMHTPIIAYTLGTCLRIGPCTSIVCGVPSVPWHGIPQTASHAVWGWSTLTHCLREREREGESHGVY